MPIEAWSCGVPYFFVPVQSRTVLGESKAEHGPLVRCHAGRRRLIDIRLLQRAGTPELRARMFAPEFGIIEDPATGSAAAAFAGYLAARERRARELISGSWSRASRWADPASCMSRQTHVTVQSCAVRVGGTAVKMSEGTLFGV